MKIKIILLIATSLLLSSCVSSSRIFFLKEPIPQRTDSLDVSAYDKKYPDADGVCLDFEKNIQHYGSINLLLGMQTWTYTSSLLTKVLVLNPKNEKITTFSIPYSSDRSLSKVYLKTTDPDGTVKLYNKNDLIQEKNSSGNNEYKFIYPDVKKGTIIEEAYEKVFNLRAFNWAPLEHEQELQFPLPCEKFSFNYGFPKDFNLKIKKIALNDTSNYPYIHDEKNNVTILHYSNTNIPEYTAEPFSPTYKETAKYLQFQITDGTMATLTFKSLKDWEEFASKFEDYTVDKGSFFYSRIEPLSKEITKNCKSDPEKLDSIVSYVQNNIEVDNSKSASSYGSVLSDKKGDIYTITGMVYSMLKKVGITGDYILIHSAEEGFLDRHYISFGQFTFPAVKVVINYKSYIVFPYIKNLPIDIIPEFIQDEPAVVISKESISDFTQIRADDSSINSLEDNYDISINENGKLTINEIKTIKGYNAYVLRKEIPELKEDNRDKIIKSLLAYSGSEINIENFEIMNLEEYREPLKIKIKYTIDNLVSVNPEDIIFQTGGLLTPASIKIINLSIEKRKNPIKIYTNENNIKNITINFPKTWKVQTEFKDSKIENCFGMLNSHTEIQDGIIKITKINNLKKGLQPKEKIKELCDLLGSNTKDVAPAIIFQRK
jgi:hypothetical protein